MNNGPVLDPDVLVRLARRIVDGDHPTEAAEERAIASFVQAVPHPRATDLLFHPAAFFDHEPSPQEIVEAALAYRGIES